MLLTVITSYLQNDTVSQYLASNLTYISREFYIKRLGIQLGF